MAHFDKNSALNDYKLRMNRLVIPFSTTAAAAASIVYSSDLPAVVTFSGEAQTSAAIAVEAAANTNFTTEVAANGIFGILLSNLGTVDKLLKYEIVHLSSGTATITAKGASSSGVTASGNIAVSIDSSLDLTATALTGVIALDYRTSKA